MKVSLLKAKLHPGVQKATDVRSMWLLTNENEPGQHADDAADGHPKAHMWDLIRD
jgi:hypothetical protein